MTENVVIFSEAFQSGKKNGGWTELLAKYIYKCKKCIVEAALKWLMIYMLVFLTWLDVLYTVLIV